MPAIDVEFHRKGEPRLWPDLDGADGAHGMIERAGILDDGTEGGGTMPKLLPASQ